MEVDKIWLTGRFNPSECSDFSEVPIEFCDESDHYLHNDVLNAWIKLHRAAEKDGLKLQIISSTRNFERQKKIWENKWNGVTLTNGINLSVMDFPSLERSSRILKYSAMPGSSRHHWGTDLDINSVEPEYFETSEGKMIYDWMNTHAIEFGFSQPYTSKIKERRFGYEEEKWHWSYLPISLKLTEAYSDLITYQDFTEFEGADTAEPMKVIEHFVLGVSKSCLPSKLWKKMV